MSFRRFIVIPLLSILIIHLNSCKKESVINVYELKYFSNSGSFGTIDFIYKTDNSRDSIRLGGVNEYSVKFTSKTPISIDAKLKPITKKANHFHLYKNGQLIQWTGAYEFPQVAIIKGEF